jgi:hypothetical protein
MLSFVKMINGNIFYDWPVWAAIRKLTFGGPDAYFNIYINYG